MKIINFYIESANRAYVLHLSNDTSHSQQDTINILRENSNCCDELLKFSNSSTLISYESKSKDIPVHVSKINVSKNVADIILSDEEIIQENILTESDESISVKCYEGHISLQNKANTPNDVEKYTIVFSFKDYKGTVCVNCSPAAQIYDVVLDFGSEASQMLIHRRDSSINNEATELLGNSLNHFYGIREYSLNEYDQQDTDKRLFRSIFFSKGANSLTIPSSDFIVAPPSSDDQYVSFISRRDNHNKGTRIPNIKLSYLADLSTNGLNIRELHRSLVMRFIHEAFRQIAEEEKMYLKKTFAASITLLLPNVMSQGEVSNFVEDVQRLVNSKTFLSHLPKGFKLSTIDVRTCSESDASLLNWINKQKHVQPGRYLIIDMGKGTTDFSVVNIKSATQAESIFRAGIIGAGNVLSYAILDNYLVHLGGIVGRKTLMKKILNAEPALLYRIEQAIEKCKRGQINESAEPVNRVNHDEVLPETIAERIEDSIPPADDFSIIFDAIVRLNIEIARRIKGLTFDYIVLSGRTFLYEPFFIEVKKVLGTLIPQRDKSIIYDKFDAKKGCLHGPLTPIDISRSSNIVGMPLVVDLTKERTLENDNDSIIESLKSRKAREDIGDILRLMTEWLRRRGAALGWIDSEQEDDYDEKYNESPSNEKISPEQEQKKQTPHTQPDEMLQIMINGIHIPNYGNNTRIYISGNAYTPVGGYQIEKGKNYDIYFDGSEFYLRTEDKCCLLRHDATNTDNNTFLFESLFPYSVQLLGNDVNIPFAKTIKQR